MVNKEEETWNYTPLTEPIPITEQVWPEGTRPLVCTRHMTYNHENYIRDCIEGVLMQKTTFPVRVCIHDDASTDKTAEIVREYQEKYPNLIWAYYQEENTFRHPNRKEMRSEFMRWAEEGKYQAVCEGDDYWTDELKLEKQVKILENNQRIVVCSHNSEWVFEDETKPKINFYNLPIENQSFEFSLEDQLKGHFSHTASLVYRNNVLHSVRKRLFNGMKKSYSGDIITMYCLLSVGNGYFIKDKMCVKRKNKGGITNDSKATKKRNYKYYKVLKALKKIVSEEKKDVIQKRIAQYQRDLVREKFKSRNIPYLLIYLLKSMRNDISWYTNKVIRRS